MVFKSWFQSLGRKHSRRPRIHGLPTPTAAAAEQLEDRSLLSVAAVFVSGELFVSSDAGDSIAIRQNATSLRVEVVANGSLLGTAPNVPTNTVTSIVVKGGDAANDIDLNLVDNLTFPSLTSIRVDGGNGNDTILGSPTYGDSLLGGDGVDTINGQGGNDTLNGGDGKDSITGGDGNDSLIGGDGSDTISGDLGNDTINGGNHADSITGGDGNDSIEAGQSNDTVSGGNGNDTITGGDGQDSLSGDAGNDSILGGGDADVISGGDDNDIVAGQAGNDSVSGDDGDDQVTGGNGNDSVSGNLGSDTVNGEAGNDTVNGNEGDDTLFGGTGNDVMRGDGTETLGGAAGNDRVNGQGGDDTLLGGGGADSLDGGAGNDTVDSADPIPESTPLTISVAGGTVLEGDAGSAILNFTVTLSQSSFLPISVDVQTADGSATLANLDFLALAQTITFAPGVTTATVAVMVTGDTVNEVDETVRLVLSAPTNGARLLNQEASGTITNDDAPPAVLFASTFFGDLYRVDQTTGATRLIGNTNQSFIHDIAQDANGQLVGYSQLGPFLFSINPATAASQITTFINGGRLLGANIEGDMAYDTVNNLIYYVRFSATGNPHLFRIDPTNGAVADIGNIVVGAANLAANNDLVDMDYLAIRNGTLYCVTGGNITGTNANFNDALFSIDTATAVATRIGPLGINLTPQAGGLDYDAVTDQFFLLEGVSGNLYRISPTTGAATLVGNTSLPTVLDVGSGLSFAIVAAQAPSTISVNNVTFLEGDTGTQFVMFQVTAQPTGGNVTVDYQTVDGTATAGTDYAAAFGTLNFGPLGGSQLVSVQVNGDFQFEGAETFFLQLTNVTGTAVGSGSGIATITNNDVAPLGDTLLGNVGNDTLIGGPSDDLLNADGGNDLLLGNGGNDTLLGGGAADTLNGGDGNDSLDGQGGPDLIESGAGDDLFVWNGLFSGSDTVTNASGADGVQVLLSPAANNVTITQSAIPVDGSMGLIQVTDGAAKLTIDSTIGQVTVNSGAGNDTVTVGDLDTVCRASLVIQGDDGNDLLSAFNAKSGVIRIRMEGGNGNDTLIGSQGDDTLDGGAGTDRLKGGNGNDLLEGGTGADSINGENGNDTVLGGDLNDSLAGDGADTLAGDAGNDSLGGGLGNDLINGGAGSDTALGGDGDDTINGADGNDSLLGESGLDSLNGNTGDDTLDGGRNNDVINGSDGNDKIRGDHGDDTINGGIGDDTINGGDGDDVIAGGDGNDLLGGGDGDDSVSGGSGDDTISGGDGDDLLLGGGGSDIVLGDQGDDEVNGQGATNTISGGQGDDTLFGPASDIKESFVLSAALLTALSAS